MTIIHWESCNICGGLFEPEGNPLHRLCDDCYIAEQLFNDSYGELPNA